VRRFDMSLFSAADATSTEGYKSIDSSLKVLLQHTPFVSQQVFLGISASSLEEVCQSKTGF
jgi:hypothetical protein